MGVKQITIIERGPCLYNKYISQSDVLYLTDKGLYMVALCINQSPIQLPDFSNTVIKH